jgi:ABC-type nitrate/sulfonate/bicarbonate transport system permease component
MTLLRRAVLALGLPVALLVTWWFASANSVEFYQPPLANILDVLPSTWFGERLGKDVLPSLTRLAVGYAGAMIIGIAVGVLVGSSRLLRALTEPVLEFLRAVPPTVLVPILILIAGIDDLMKIVVIIVGCVWPVLLNTVEGVRAAERAPL